MSEHCYRVGIHGPPDPKKHPWVMVRQAVGTVGPEWQMRSANYVMTWDPSVEWTPWEPPSELAPVEDQGVEVRGYLYRQRWDGDVEVMRDGKWLRTGTPEMYRDYAEIAQALGLVDQPPVPRALVEWVTDRLPNDDEYPVLWGKDGHMRTAPRRDRDWYLAKGWRWVSLSVLLDAAGLGER